MNRVVSVREAKAQLSRLLRAVETGEAAESRAASAWLSAQSAPSHRPVGSDWAAGR